MDFDVITRLRCYNVLEFFAFKQIHLKFIISYKNNINSYKFKEKSTFKTTWSTNFTHQKNYIWIKSKYNKNRSKKQR